MAKLKLKMKMKGKKMEMLNIDFTSLLQQTSGTQKKLDIVSPLSVYFGYSQEGLIRLSFLSTCKQQKCESTANLRVSYIETATGYWSHFDLLEREQEVVFLSFVKNLIESVSYCTTEEQALIAVKQRFATWKSLFKKNISESVSKEEVQGVYGELLFLHNYMMPKYGVNRSVLAWAGPDKKSKDFAIDDNWFEIKTIGANTSKVHISSMTQLSFDKPGTLVVIKVEAMADEYENECSNIAKLFYKIKKNIEDEAIEEVFFSKLSATGVAQSDNAMNVNFEPKEELHYRVDEYFPKITERNKPFSEICDVEYDLSLNALGKYLEH